MEWRDLLQHSSIIGWLMVTVIQIVADTGRTILQR